MSNSVELRAVSVLAELDRLKWEYKYTSGDEITCRCPAHADKSPSCSLNTSTKVWKCHTAGCGASGDFISFLALVLKTTRSAVADYIRVAYETEDTIKTVDSTAVELWHEKIWEASALRQELYNRGLSDDTIRQFRLGVDETNRITIPIANKQGLYVNVRRYKPGAPGKEKMRNTKGMGRIRLYPLDQLKYPTIVLCGGECKALAVLQRLNAQDIGAITATGGEDNWDNEFSPLFREKRVYVCYDIDNEGVAGAHSVAARLSTHAEFVGVVSLPLDKDKYPKGDVNDYFGLERATDQDFLALLSATKQWEPPIQVEEEKQVDAIPLQLASTTKAEYARKRITTNAVISAMDTTPYLVPKEVGVQCDKNQPFCISCPVYPVSANDAGYVMLTINSESPQLLELVNAGSKTKKDSIRQALKIPACKSCAFHVRTHYNLEDVRLTPQLEIGSHQTDTAMLPAMTVSHGLEMNTPYKFTGRLYPHPRTQQAILLIGDVQATEDALETYKPDDESLSVLSIFQPQEWTVEGIQSKLDALYHDLECNVTRIYQRRALHLAVDLVYHSPLLLNFDNRVEKGWAEALVVGDSAQGKSETARRLMQHYGLGEKVEVKNASIAGLLGGLQQLGNRWMVTWGVIPRHDRRLVVLEELKGASIETIGRLTDMRSSGIAEIDKIERRRTHARTRILALSNPRSELPLASYSYGIEAVRELIGSPEDIRRFDFAILLSANDVSSEVMNSRPVAQHLFTASLCKQLVLWAWTRLADQVSIEDEMHLLDEANRLCSIFTDVIPLVDRGSMRMKLLRLSASLAARTASFGETNQHLLVRRCHVAYVSSWLEANYSTSVFGYRAFSEAWKKAKTLTDPDEVIAQVLATPFPLDFIEQTINTDAIELRDICDWTGWEKPMALELLSLLVRKKALVRVGRGYRKNPEYIELLKSATVQDAARKVTSGPTANTAKRQF